MSCLLDLITVSFASWTLGCNLAGVLGSSPFHACLFSLGFVLMLSWSCLPGLIRDDPAGKQEERAARSFSFPAHRGLLLLSIGVFCAFALTGNFAVYVPGIILISSASLVFASKSSTAPERAAPFHKMDIFLIVLLCIAAALIGLGSRRPDADDCVYLNQAVEFANRFFQPIMTHPSIFKDFESSSIGFVFGSFNQMNGLLSLALGMEPIEVSSYILAPILSALVVLAYTAAFRFFLPSCWRRAILSLFVLFVAEGTSHAFFPNFAFVRIWQGKAVLLHLLIPLLSVQSVAFGETGSRQSFIRMILLQTCAAGLSAVALWIAPPVALIGVLAGIISSGSSIGRILPGLASSFYPLLAAFYLATQFPSLPRLQAFPPPDYVEMARWFFGTRKEMYFWLGAQLLACCAIRGIRLRIFCAVSSCLVFLTFLNPYLESLIATFVTSPHAYWRSFWILGLPITVGGVFCWPPSRRFPVTAFAGTALSILGIVLYTILIPDKWVLGPQNISGFSIPSLKVLESEYSVAQRAADMTKEGGVIIAPEEISWMLPTFKKRTYPFVPRVMYIDENMDPRAGDRMRMIDLLNGKAPLDEAWLHEIIRSSGSLTIIYPASIGTREALARMLGKEGFSSIEDSGYIIASLK